MRRVGCPLDSAATHGPEHDQPATDATRESTLQGGPLSTPDRSTGSGARPDDPRWRPTPTKIVVAVILLVGIVVPLLVSTYDLTSRGCSASPSSTGTSCSGSSSRPPSAGSPSCCSSASASVRRASTEPHGDGMDGVEAMTVTINWPALIVLILLFAAVTVWASWRPAGGSRRICSPCTSGDSGGKSFGTVIDLVPARR